MATENRADRAIALGLWLSIVTQTGEIVEQGTDTRDVLFEGVGIGLGYIGEGDRRDVACSGSSIGRGSRGGGSQEAGADNGRLQEGRDCCNRIRPWSQRPCGVSAPF